MNAADGTFNQWLAACDARLRFIVGVGVHDVGDYLWMDAYRAGQTVDETLADAVEFWRYWGDLPDDIADIALGALGDEK